jgi:hypothetical protein
MLYLGCTELDDNQQFAKVVIRPPGWINGGPANLLQPGDVLVASFADHPVSVSAPTCAQCGTWNHLPGMPYGDAGNGQLDIWTHTFTGSEPTYIFWPFSGVGARTGEMCAYRGVTETVDNIATFNNNDQATNTVTFPAVSTGGNNDLVLRYSTIRNDAGTWTAPASNFLERDETTWYSGSYDGLIVGEYPGGFLNGTAPATNGAISASSYFAAASFALRSAGSCNNCQIPSLPLAHTIAPITLGTNQPVATGKGNHNIDTKYVATAPDAQLLSSGNTMLVLTVMEEMSDTIASITPGTWTLWSTHSFGGSGSGTTVWIYTHIWHTGESDYIVHFNNPLMNTESVTIVPYNGVNLSTPFDMCGGSACHAGADTDAAGMDVTVPAFTINNSADTFYVVVEGGDKFTCIPPTPNSPSPINLSLDYQATNNFVDGGTTLCAFSGHAPEHQLLVGTTNIPSITYTGVLAPGHSGLPRGVDELALSPN